jgi:hypothetical protein
MEDEDENMNTEHTIHEGPLKDMKRFHKSDMSMIMNRFTLCIHILNHFI